MLKRENLHAYQRDKMIPHIKENKKCAQFVDMGLGKTVAVITAISDLFNEFEIAKVLIVGPLRVMLSTWPEELRKWEHTRHLSFAQLAGKTVPQRKEVCLHDDSDIHLINRENIVWLVKHYTHDWPYDMIVIDESSSFKSHTAERFKALAMVLQAVGIERVVLLTGTPTSNGLMDIWSQIYLIDGGERLGYSVWSYRKRYFDHNRYKHSWTIRPGSSEVIHEKLQDVCLRLDADDYLQMPDKVINDVHIKMPSQHRNLYEKLERDFLVKVGEETIVASFAAALSNKLLQFCNGAAYLDDSDRYQNIHDGKLNALEEIIESAGGEPILVAYQYRSDKERILKKFKKAIALDKDPDTITLWNEGDIPILVAHPASAGHGLNLQKGGHIIVWFGLTWSLELYQQFNARLYRQGQTKPVIVHRIMMDNTIEEKVVESLNGKYQTQYELLDALRT